jgi:hypothetical protein
MHGDLTDLTAMHRAIEGCVRVFFGMSVSAGGRALHLRILRCGRPD